MSFQELLTDYASLVILAAFLGALFYAALSNVLGWVIEGIAWLVRRLRSRKAAADA